MRWNKSPRLLFVAMLSSSLIACGGSSSDKDSPTDKISGTPAAQGTTLYGGTNISQSQTAGQSDRKFGNLQQDGAEIFVAGQASDSLSNLRITLVDIDKHPKKDALKAAIPDGVAVSDVGQLIVLERDDSSGSAQPQDFAKPVEVTVKVHFSAPNENKVPVILYFDEATNTYSPVAIKSIDRSAGTVTFLTAHTSIYRIVWASDDLIDVNSGFDPSQDSFLVPDLFTFGGNSGGNSYGISAYVTWWYKQIKITTGTGVALADLFKDETTPDKAETTQRLFNQLYKGSYNKAALQAAQDLSDQIALLGNAQTQVNTGTTLLQTLLLTEQPQLLVMAAIDNICIVGGAICDADAQEIQETRTVAVYKYDKTKELFSFYDPNFPSEEVTIKWNKADGFTDWSKSKSTNTKYNAYGFAALNTAFSPTTLKDLAAKADKELKADPATKTADIEITEPVAADEVRKNVYAIDQNVQDQLAVRIVGTIKAPNTTGSARYVHAFLNGALQASAYPVNSGDNSFSIDLGTLPNASGTDVILFVSDNPNSWAGGTTAISHQLSIRVKGNEFFKNLGFETGDLKDQDGLDLWSSYQYWWWNIIAGSSTEPAPKGFQPTFDLEKNATKPSPKSAVVSANSLLDNFGRISTYNANKVAGFDPIATDLQVPYYGSHALRINNSDNGEPISSVIQVATVPNDVANPTINFRWAAVLEDPTHDPEQQPFVEVTVEDLDETDPNKKILYNAHFYSGDPNYLGWVTYDAYGNKKSSPDYRGGTPWHAIPWQQVNVSVAGRAGNRIKLTVVGASCHPSAHGGYVYLDAEE